MGTYSVQINPGTDGQTQTCQNCDADMTGWTSPEGSTSINDCTCKAGFTSDLCTECLAATFKNTTGHQACTPCPTGHITPPGNPKINFDTACVPCEEGKYKLTAAACQDCHSDSTSAIASDDASDCLCKIGFTLISAKCELCPGGTVKFEVGNEACTRCDDRSFRPVGGPNTCINCRANSRIKPGGNNFADSDCLCEEGYESGNSECYLCPEGKFKLYLNQTNCEQCPGESYYSKSSPPYIQNKCEVCPSHSIARGNKYGKEKCFCKDGFRRIDADTCEEIPPGVFQKKTKLKVRLTLNVDADEFASDFLRQNKIKQKFADKFDVTVDDVTLIIVQTERRRLLQQLAQIMLRSPIFQAPMILLYMQNWLKLWKLLIAQNLLKMKVAHLKSF